MLLLGAAAATHACRCAQQALAAYFGVAEEVVMARLTGWEPVAVEVPERHLDPDASDNDTLVGLLDVAGFSHAGAVRVFERPTREGNKARVIDDYAALETSELAYESPAAVVYARVDGWYRLRLSSGEFAWLPAEYAGSYFAYDELPVRRLAYIRRPWHGFIWPEPGAGIRPRPLSLPVALGSR